MTTLAAEGLPFTVEIDGWPFGINTDFRVWIRFCQEFEQWDQKSDWDVSYIFAGEVPALKGAQAMNAILSFAYPPAKTPKYMGGTQQKVLDYDMDADFIFSAFMGQYGIDLIEKSLHWHKFCALLRGIGDSTRLYEIMGYRSYEGNDKDMLRLRSAWELPVPLSKEEQQVRQQFDEYFD